MKLTTKEAELFFELMGSLQFFVNDRLKLVKGIRTVEEYNLLPHEEKFTVREKIYEQPELIDKYVTANPHRLDAQNLNAVKQWK